MVKGLYTAYTGMIQEQHRMDTLANNLANADTIGFKKEGTTSQSFDAMLIDKIKDGSEYAGLARRIGSVNPGVKIGEGYVDWSQGSFQVTGNSYDFALAGDGFFSIEFTNKNGETSTMYTRDGNFQVTRDGYLVTQDGDYVLGKNGRIQLDVNADLVMQKDGSIYQNDQKVAQLQLSTFADYNYLKHYGENYYYPVEGATLEDANNISVEQGYLEVSNVSTVSEMVQMISVSRQYEANQKIIQTMDTSLQTATELGRIK